MSLLKEHVERIVADVRATEARKDLMREELLAHLADVYREEAGRLGEGRQAAERAIERLGEPAELTESLQAAVPASERVLFTPIPFTHALDALDRATRRRNDETPVRHAARVTGWTVAVIVAEMAFVVAFVMVANAKGKRLDVPAAASFAVASLVCVGLGAFVSPLLCGAMARSLRDDSRRGRRSAWPALYAALSSLAVIVTLLIFVQIAERGSGHGPLFARTDWPRLLVLSLLGPPFVVATASSINSRRRRSEVQEIPGAPV